MSSARNRRAVAEKVIDLCGAYIHKSCAGEMGYIVLTYDMLDGKSGSRYETDMPPASAVIVLRNLADKIENSDDADVVLLRH